MRPVTDMLGQFFSGRKAAAAHPSPATTLDSATEESHTRHLLYPESNTLYHPEGQPYPLHGASLLLGSGHDGPLPEIDLEFPRDCRIIIAQDETASMPKTILFDSKPGPPRAESPTQSTRARAFGGVASASTAGPTFGGLHARRSSLVTESTTPRSPTVGGFARSRTRGNSISSMPNIDEHSQALAKGQSKARDSTDLLNICLDCMFGNTPMNYRGNSNKIHIVPLDPKPAESAVLSPNLQDATNSLGRADGLRRRSHLAKSYTPGNPPPELPPPDAGSSTSKEPRRRTIFITRMFSVTIPDDDQDTSNVPTPTPQNSLGNGNGFPFPRTGAKGGAPRMPPSRKNRRAGWAFIDSNFGVESLLSTSLSSDVDDRVDVVGQHWDVIMRALTSLQFVVQERILASFKKAEIASPPVLPQPRTQPSRSSMRETPLPPIRRALRLQPHALMFDQEIKKAVELAGNRIVSGMRIPRVLTGQGKWGVWREEARWLGRWAGRREENFFFFNLLTAFLGNHTEWLNLLGPKWHRKRHREQQKSSAGENLIISNRTVIVSPDKMAARRLIFLLAAFLPPNTSTVYDGASPMRPSTSASLRAYSQSPPTNMPPSRRHSLRRHINRRPRGKQSMTNMRLQPPATNGASLSTLESANTRSDSGVAEFHEAPRHSRRSSAHSIRTSLVIPSMSDSVATSKGSTATVATATPQNAVPVAHFTLPRTKSSGPSPEDRPESSDSLASANLMHTLQRSGTGHTSNPSTDSGNSSRWSGFMNFWSGRRGSSTDHSDYLQSTDDGLGIAGSAYRGTDRPRSQLEQMVQDLSMDGVFGDADVYEPSTSNASTATENSPETFPLGTSGVTPSAARPIPERPKTFDSTLKLSVNEKDGVIDVDISLPDFGSPLQSPLLGGYASASSQHGSSYGESSVLSMPCVEPEQPVNAAGWLKQFHPDFAVQAIKPYAELERDIKWAMSAEPTPITSAATPTLEQGPLERWVDVCSALVADTRTFSIKRLRLRRLVRLIPIPTYQASAMTPGIAGMPPGRSQYGNPYTAGSVAPMMTEVHLDEKFYEEQIMDFDATLIDAVDRVLAQSGQASRVQSASSSRSSSRRGRRDTRSGSDAGHHMEVAQTDCKAVIFDALESVVKNVTAERNRKDESKEETRGENKAIQEVAKPATDSSLREGIRRWLTEVE
ncbi:hypothetical protein BU26DRAFT_496983 [Trematosphaeria pertusa]|uniref:Folliculin-interacting protein N-terminal domain-containing protein n=1 Tax=Trematosphaeria pertusa TaxID=390896 RepID=A0A6A6HTF5_9PLEO|nr:uncharacterized protein BU26DRAFT_496983 [Trematosphaeria pertusa]KAF2241038.1 hypothetical protein BU26DRAFT_496983 [Trematosphaeria pertusa]